MIDYFSIKQKKCSKCGLTKPIEDYAIKSSLIGKRSPDCKVCHRKIRKVYYDNNTSLEKMRVRGRASKIKMLLASLKEQLVCQRCGEDHVACLQFHHIDPSLKDINISQAASNGWSLDRIKSEMAKCNVLCANCHFKEHYNQRV
jgi:hypothetical protein